MQGKRALPFEPEDLSTSYSSVVPARSPPFASSLLVLME